MASMKFNNVYLKDYYSIAGPLEKDGQIKKFDATLEDRCSMGMLSINNEVITGIEECLSELFNDPNTDLLNDELVLTDVFSKLITIGRIKVLSYPTNSEWFGVTSAEDIPEVIEMVHDAEQKGIYGVPLTETKGLIKKRK